MRLIVINIINSGDLSILSTDFIEPITFIIGAQGKILDGDVLKTKPDGLSPYLTVNYRKAVLKPIMLNSQDSIKLSLLVTGHNGDITSEGRIIGVKQIKQVDRGFSFYKRPSRRFLFISIFLLIFGLILSIYPIFRFMSDGQLVRECAPFVPTVFSCYILLFYVIIGGVSTIIGESLLLVYIRQRNRLRYSSI